jgi:hypothetical protein
MSVWLLLSVFQSPVYCTSCVLFLLFGFCLLLFIDLCIVFFVPNLARILLLSLGPV